MKPQPSGASHVPIEPRADILARVAEQIRRLPPESRLDWTAPRTAAGRSPIRPGGVDPVPSAVRADASLHLAVDHDGTHAWVRRTSDAAAARAWAADHRVALEIAAHDDIVVPSVLAVRAEDVWIARPPWAPVPQPVPRHVDRYVEGAVTSALAQATVLCLGDPHVAPDGTLIVEDAAVAARLETDQCDLLGAVLLGIAHGSAAEITTSIASLSGPPPPTLARAVDAGLLSLALEWTPVAFGHTLVQIGHATDPLPGCAPLRLLASDVLHRLDLAHEHPRGLTALRSPQRVIDLVDRARRKPIPCADQQRPPRTEPLTPTTTHETCSPQDRPTWRRR